MRIPVLLLLCGLRLTAGIVPTAPREIGRLRLADPAGASLRLLAAAGDPERPAVWLATAGDPDGAVKLWYARPPEIPEHPIPLVRAGAVRVSALAGIAAIDAGRALVFFSGEGGRLLAATVEADTGRIGEPFTVAADGAPVARLAVASAPRGGAWVAGVSAGGVLVVRFDARGAVRVRAPVPPAPCEAGGGGAPLAIAAGEAGAALLAESGCPGAPRLRLALLDEAGAVATSEALPGSRGLLAMTGEGPLALVDAGGWRLMSAAGKRIRSIDRPFAPAQSSDEPLRLSALAGGGDASALVAGRVGDAPWLARADRRGFIAHEASYGTPRVDDDPQLVSGGRHLHFVIPIRLQTPEGGWQKAVEVRTYRETE